MKRNSKYLWGVYLIGAAATVIANALYGFMDFVPLIALIVLFPIMFMCISHTNFGGVFIPLAILGIIFDEQLGIEAITPLPIIAAAVLLTIAFTIIFNKHNKFIHTVKFDFDDIESIGDSETSCTVKFGESTKYFTCENLEKAYLKCEFGELIAYFDDATLSPEGATLYIDANFGGVELFIPKQWNVKHNMSAFLGGVDEKRKNIPDPDSPTLTIIGKVNFAGVEIRYV